MGSTMVFRDRDDAAEQLAEALKAWRDRPGLLVLGLPRGGVPIARIVGDALDAPVDVFLVRKLGVPVQPELAFGAIAEASVGRAPVQVLDHSLISDFGLTNAEVGMIVRRELAEIERRSRLYRGDRLPAEVDGREIILIDDGLATGSTMLAAVRALQQEGARRITVAVPVGPRETCRRMQKEADEVVCVCTPADFRAVGLWYVDFRQVTDQEVRNILAQSRHQPVSEH